MKRISAVLVVVVIVGAMASAAVTAGRGSIEISTPVMVGGAKLEPGRYSVEWTSEGDAAKVVLRKGKQEVSATGKLVELAAKPTASSFVRNAADNSVAEMRFRGNTTAITFAQ